QRADRLPARRGARRAFSCRRALRMSWRHGLAAAALLLAGGCESIGYYRQAIEGHLGVMASARPIDAWLADPSTSPALRERLQTPRRIPQYPTLGWFDDPLLSSFILYSDAQLARLIFHELAHQVVYAGGDSTFNESFAVVVEEEGVRRWLEAEGRSAELAAFRAAQERRREFAARVEAARERLKSIYRGSLPREGVLEL